MRRYQARLPLYTVLPCAVLVFWLGYHWLWRLLLLRFGPQGYARLIERTVSYAERCFRANVGSLVHSVAVVVLLISVLATDKEVYSRRLEPHYNAVGYSAMCVTLGYFSLSVPWSLHLFFVEKRSDVVPWPMLVHHGLVVCGALSYVVSNRCAVYGAVGFSCMELSNWFYIPRIFLEMLGENPNDSRSGRAFGVLLVFTFLVFRIGVGTWAFVSFSRDIARFSGSSVAWVFVLIPYVVFAGVLLLSWVWLHTVLSELRGGVNEIFQRRKQKLNAAAKNRQKTAKEEENDRKITAPSKRSSFCTRGVSVSDDDIISKNRPHSQSSSSTVGSVNSSSLASSLSSDPDKEPPGVTTLDEPNDDNI